MDTGISAAYNGPASALEVVYEVRDFKDKPDFKLERERITAVSSFLPKEDWQRPNLRIRQLYTNRQQVLLDEWKEVPAAPRSKL